MSVSHERHKMRDESDRFDMVYCPHDVYVCVFAYVFPFKNGSCVLVNVPHAARCWNNK